MGKSGGKAFNMNKLKQQIAIDEQKAEVESKRQRELEIEKELKIVNVKEIDDDLAAVLNDLDDDIVESKNDNSGINRRRRGKLKKQATKVMLLFELCLIHNVNLERQISKNVFQILKYNVYC